MAFEQVAPAVRETHRPESTCRRPSRECLVPTQIGRDFA